MNLKGYTSSNRQDINVKIDTLELIEVFYKVGFPIFNLRGHIVSINNVSNLVKLDFMTLKVFNSVLGLVFLRQIKTYKE